MKIINRNSKEEVFNFKLKNHIEYLKEKVRFYLEGSEIAKESKSNGLKVNAFFNNQEFTNGKNINQGVKYE